MSIINGLTDFFMKCPLLKDGVFRVDALGQEAVEYMLEPVLAEPVLQKYVNGDTERQYQFNFCSREYYSMDRLQNIANSEFYEELAEWIEEMNDNEDFPEMPEKCYPQSIEALTTGYIFDVTMKKARYQIQLRLVYYKEK